METETIWKDIVGFEGLYLISNKGQVLSIPRTITRSDGVKQKINTGILNDSIDEKGIHRVGLCKEGKNYTKTIHVLVANTFITNPNNYKYVKHIDGNPNNNIVENLEWSKYHCNPCTSFINNITNNNIIIDGNELFDIKEFEGLYKINKQGEIYSIKASIKDTITINNQLYIKTKLVKRKATKTKTGLLIGLYDPISNQYKNKYIHRLLAELFIPNPLKYKYVIHIDNDVFNNELSNLKWTDQIDSKMKPANAKKIKITDISTKKYIIFDTIKDAAKHLHTSNVSISKCINENKYLNYFKVEEVI